MTQRLNLIDLATAATSLAGPAKVKVLSMRSK